MTNFQVYKKTLPFSLVEFLVSLLALFILAGLCSAGFFLFSKQMDHALIGLAVGFIVDIIIVILINIFVTNRVKAT